MINFSWRKNRKNVMERDPRMENPEAATGRRTSRRLCASLCLDFTFFPVTHKCSSCKACPCSSADPLVSSRFVSTKQSKISPYLFPYVARRPPPFSRFSSAPFPSHGGRRRRGRSGISRVTLCGDCPPPLSLFSHLNYKKDDPGASGLCCVALHDHEIRRDSRKRF